MPRSYSRETGLLAPDTWGGVRGKGGRSPDATRPTTRGPRPGPELPGSELQLGALEPWVQEEGREG